VLGYNPHKPGRPSHTYPTYLMANLRLILDVEVQVATKALPPIRRQGFGHCWSASRIQTGLRLFAVIATGAMMRL
jgi:hypothetical protein